VSSDTEPRVKNAHLRCPPGSFLNEEEKGEQKKEKKEPRKTLTREDRTWLLIVCSELALAPMITQLKFPLSLAVFAFSRQFWFEADPLSVADAVKVVSG
jgi:hypothetical protein